MSRSFFLGNDAELQAGSANFAAKISATPTTYGLTAAMATQYAAVDATWQAAYLAATTADTRTTPKVLAKNDARAQVKAMASLLAKIVEGTATVTNEQKADLGLAVRGVPQPTPAPGAAYKIKATINPDGSLELTWKCDNPRGASGTLYQIWRRIEGGEFTYLGGSGSKKFVDTTIPAGASSLTYQIQAVRSTAIGPWAQFNVNFGTAPGGTMTAAVTQTKVSPKIAA